MFTKIRNYINTNQLTTFLLIAFGYSWTFLILLARFAPHQAQLIGNFRLAVYGPTLAALIVPLLIAGPKGFLKFLGRRLTPKGSPIWYGVALFLIPVLLLILRGIHSLVFPGLPLELPVLKGQAANILVGFLMALTFGPLAEELGWRGFALPELQKRLNPLGPGPDLVGLAFTIPADPGLPVGGGGNACAALPGAHHAWFCVGCLDLQPFPGQCAPGDLLPWVDELFHGTAGIQQPLFPAAGGGRPVGLRDPGARHLGSGPDPERSSLGFCGRGTCPGRELNIEKDNLLKE